MNPWIPITSTLALCGALAACDNPSAHAQANAHASAHVQRTGNAIEVLEGSPLRARLQMDTVQSAEIERPLSAPGVIEAAAEKLVRVTPPVAGRVVRLHRNLGDVVKAGEPLFTMDSAEISEARSDHTKALAEAQQAKREMERQKLLYEADIVARKDYEAAQLALDSANSDARASADRLAQLGAGNGAGSRRDYVLRSPINGRVVELAGSQGGYWNDINESIMTVADLSSVWVTANVAERDISQLFIGQQVHISLTAYPHEPVGGQVKYISELLDADTRSVKVRVAVDNPQGRLRPGMFARVAFDGQKQAALTVPASALQQSGLSTRVFVEKTPFHFEPRTVTVGAQVGERMEIVSGLTAGERIVVKEGVLLND